MYDDLYPEAAQTALDAKAARPPEPKQTPRFSLWGTTAAVPKGVAAGAAQAAGSTADVLGAFGSVLGTEGSAGGMFSLPTPEEEKQQREATEKLRANGPDYMSEGGRSFRNVAKDYTPDPLTTHAAERMVFDFARMGSKAITAAVTMGGIPGAVVAGAEEGFTVSDQLAQEGVNLGTRSAVGGVTAVTNALSFGLPVAGKTAVQTGVLALTGGPLSFMAQNAATRKILQDADYSKLADQYDPFDPLGLALSTVIPLGFGALAMRGVKAKGPMPDGSPPPDVPPLKAPDDLVDAARVTLLRENMDATNPKPGDLEAADAHNKAYKQAMEQQAAGERVSVADIAPKIDDAQPAKVDAVTNQNDVVGNQGGRSADDILPGALAPVDRVKKAARDVYDTFKKRTGADGDAARFEVEDNSTPVPFRAGAAEQELENLGWDIGDRMAAYASNDASHYITARKLVASDAEYGDEYVTAKIRISNHGNTTKAHDHPDVNIAPGEDIVWDIEEKLNQKITDEGYELPVSAPSDKRAAGQKIRESDATETVASDGAPDVREITVYHGTETSFDNFESGMFTSNRSRAENYAMGGAKRVIEARLDIQNPMPWADAFGKTPEEIKAAGFDGTVQWGANGEVVRAVVVDPAQVKKVSSPETVDAARTSLLRESVDKTNPLPKDLAAAQPHADAHAKAIDQMASGERVNVADVLPENVAVKATQDMAARVEPIRKELAKANLMDFMGESKVVTPDGEPLVVYHGTHEAFDTFDPQKIGSSTDPGYFGEGFYFTKSAQEASSYTGLDGSNVMPAYLNLRNPYEMPSQSRFQNREAWQAALKNEGERLGVDLKGDPKAITAALKAAGYDGVVWYSAKGADEYVAFSPKQIKSALGNSGLFDPRSGSLTDPVKPPFVAKDEKATTQKEPAAKPADGEKPASYHEKEATRLALENPDVMVMVEGMDAPKPLSEVMAMIKKDLADDIEDSNLIQVAAECSISTGAGGM